jgi:beta-galactosidase
MMTAYSTTLIADGHDNTLIRVALTDSAGREIRNISAALKINLVGDATLSQLENSNEMVLTSQSGDTSTWISQLVEGLCRFTLIAGNIPGKIKIEASYDSLWPGSHEIHTLNPEFKSLKPASEQLKPVNKKTGRYIGADISFLPQFEARGRKYFENGKDTDLVGILARNGFNAIRLRIFVNPENEKGYSPVTGFCGLKNTLAMASRAKKNGMKLLLNFHYSDYWADPQQQYKPLAWDNIGFESLKDSVKSYTIRVLEALKDAGCLPEMVQVGNEINHGFLWPDGHIGNPDKLAALLKAGVEGVREVDPSIILMMHIALGGQNKEAVFWLDNMIARGVDFDILGLSYYPRWHGTLEDLKANMDMLTLRYGKEINVVEYSIFSETVNEIVFGLDNNMGQGTFIWEPLNMFFDREGNPRDVLAAYKQLKDKYLQNKE